MTSIKEHGASVVGRVGGTIFSQVRSVIRPSTNVPAGTGRSTSGWLVVTVFGEPADIKAATLPTPLAEYGDRIEVEIRAAAGGKGTELAARLRDPAPSSSTSSALSGNDPQAELRSALRRAEQLIEVGEVLVVDPAPHGKCTPIRERSPSRTESRTSEHCSPRTRRLPAGPGRTRPGYRRAITSQYGAQEE